MLEMGAKIVDSFIPVVFSDGSPGKMVAVALDLCLRQNRIRSFRRADGWVVIGIDPMRGMGSMSTYAGPDRRGGVSV